MNEIAIHINGRSINAVRGETVMQAAERAGIVIPRLCYHPAVRASGACRLCAVEIEGYRGLPASCSTEVAEGMKVETSSPRVLEFRKELLLSILKDHPRECLACPRNGTCELQQLVKAVGIAFPYEMPVKAREPAKPAGAYFERDYGLCVHCGRCVRVCHEVRGNRAIVFRETGGRQEVATQLGKSLEEAGCQFCGACLDVCPVGALRELPPANEKALHAETSSLCNALADIVMALYKRQLAHEVKSSTCPICSAGCSMLFDVASNGAVLSVRPDPKGTLNRGQACVQGRFLLKEYLQAKDRLKRPMIRKGGSLEEVSWDEALSAAATGFARYSPQEIAVITDARFGVQEILLLAGFAGKCLRSQALHVINGAEFFDCFSTIKKYLGSAALTPKEETLKTSDGIVVLGLNLSAHNPILSVAVREASMKGARLMVANPLETSLGRLADLNLAFYPGSEDVLLKGLIRLLIGPESRRASSPGLGDAWHSDLKERLMGYDPETVSRLTGVSEELLAEASCLLSEMKSPVFIFGGGFNGSSPDALKSLGALYLIKKAAGAPALFPVCWDVNIQGGWEAGLFSGSVDGVRVEAMRGNHARMPENAKAAFVVTRNLAEGGLSSLADLLKGLDFVTVAAEREPGFIGDIVFPVASALEAGGELTDFMGRRTRVNPVIAPKGEARPFADILKDLARRFGLADLSRMKYRPGTAESFDDSAFTWEPTPPIRMDGEPEERFPYALFSKERLSPYFLGPLMAPEARKVFDVEGDIIMNPADAYAMEFMPGEMVHIETIGGDAEGRLGLNAAIARGMVAISNSPARALLQGDQGPVFCKIKKAS
jgi:predicted molibdopterin-dependent oxidoreductase YjgC